MFVAYRFTCTLSSKACKDQVKAYEGDLDAARPLMEGAVAICESALGPEHHRAADRCKSGAQPPRRPTDARGIRTAGSVGLDVERPELRVQAMDDEVRVVLDRGVRIKRKPI